jgi:hypothetical protein
MPDPTITDPTITRAGGVVWRVAADRVLVRWVGGRGDGASSELLGAAAVVWAALDEPRTSGTLAASLDADEATIGAAVDALSTAGLIVVGAS